MGYTLNLCKFHIYNVPYNHNITEEGMKMTQDRIRIADVADALGLSTATVSKVIHGKTEKISDDQFRLAVSLIIFRRRKWIISLC